MSRRLRVMQAFKAPRATTNPYIVMLDESLGSADGLEHLRFSWGSAIFGRYDAIHFHWPEAKFGGASRLRAMGKRFLFAALLARLTCSRVAIVRTMHNIELPQGMPRSELAMIRRLDRLTTLRIALNPTTPIPADAASETILHGHYRDWYASYPQPPALQGRLGYVGLIRRYKGVELLLEAFAEAKASDDALSLSVSGKPSSTELTATITELAGAGVELDLRFLSDAELVVAVSRSELVVLPYRFMHNSGGTLAALSLDRPVLIPENDTNRALSAEVGAGWVHQYAGDLDGETLRRTMDEVRRLARADRPDLSARDWDAVGAQHVRAFRRAVAIRRGRSDTGSARSVAPVRTQA